MTLTPRPILALFACMLGILSVGSLAVAAEYAHGAGRVSIPKTWDDAAISTLELPLADPRGSPKHIRADYYYRIPVRPIYKQYPVFAPGHEPPGYLDWLRQQEPSIVWDAQGHRPPLLTEEDWIRAGEIVFDAPIILDPGVVLTFEDVRSRGWYSKGDVPVPADGRVPFLHYVVREKGKLELGVFSCAMCHTRVLPDGAVVKGAQGNYSLERALSHSTRLGPPPYMLPDARRSLWAVPWLNPDPLDALDHLSPEQLVTFGETIPPGVNSRHRTSPLFPPHVPDLIGVQDRHYLDATGLQQHRSPVDLMRYAALNQGADALASFNGFIPADRPRFQHLPDPADPVRVGGRYSDEQLYALALYIYSLRPPRNPNVRDAVAERGQSVFERSGCPACHTPPFYTNNKLTLAEGFTPPPGSAQNQDILLISVGTDPNLTMKTRRGTGYYKVPSLRGVWYRSMFGHSGWCATLEDWFDPRRTREDYVPTGFKPYGAKTYPVKGHPFGLALSQDDRSALIAFLKTL